MKTKKNYYLLLCAFLCVNALISQSVNFGDIDYTKAINMAGKQRMLSQKMAKDFLLLTLGIHEKDVSTELKSSTFIFGKQLGILNENAETSLLKEFVKKEEDLWVAFKKALNLPPNVRNSQSIVALSSKLLDASHNLVINIEAKSEKDNPFIGNGNHEMVKIINISGKQRMLSQKLCLYYAALKLFPDQNSKYQAIISKIFVEFDGVINKLLLNKHTTKESKEELIAAMAMWEELKSNKKDILNGTKKIEDVFTSTNALTKIFNNITGIYEIVSRNHSITQNEP